jgi:hypothetical protein
MVERNGLANNRRRTMPAKSKAQQKAAGAALAAKRGEQKVSELKDASKSMYDSMSEKELEDLAETSRQHKPDHVSDTSHKAHKSGH